jgi:trigger factor
VKSSGRLDDVREEVLARKAIDVVADSAKPIPLEQAAAREKIWTPEKGEAEKPSELWTPGS